MQRLSDQAQGDHHLELLDRDNQILALRQSKDDQIHQKSQL